MPRREGIERRLAPGSTADLGRIRIQVRAVARIVSEALQQCYGVVGLAPSPRLGAWLGDRLGWGEAERGVEVRSNADGVELEVYIVVSHGTPIGVIARNVQQTLKYAVEQALGIPVTAVHVNVRALQVPEEPEDEEER